MLIADREGGQRAGRDAGPDHGQPDRPQQRVSLGAQDEGADGTDGWRAPAPFRHAGTSMTPLHQITVPAHDGIGPDEEPQVAQDVAGQRRQEGGEEGRSSGGP